MPRNALIFYSLAALIVVALALNIRYDESGFINYYNKNYADAVPVLMESVDFGDGYAAVLIGKFHETRRQFELASKWHLKAAKLGEFRAIVWFLQTAIRRPNSAQNHVVSRRCAPVLRILNRAVAAGDAMAAVAVGGYYQDGSCVKRDRTMAARYYLLASQMDPAMSSIIGVIKRSLPEGIGNDLRPPPLVTNDKPTKQQVLKEFLSIAPSLTK